MPRIRYLKPEFFTNDRVGALCPLARLLWQGLWCMADREGRLKDRPARLKVEVLPYDDVSIDVLLAELVGAGFIIRYEAGGERYIALPSFLEHQSPHTKERPSIIPAPCSSSAVARQAPDEHQTSTRRTPDEHQTSIGQASEGSGASIGTFREASPHKGNRKGTEREQYSARAREDVLTAADNYRLVCDAWMEATGSTLPPESAERMDGYAERLSLPWVLDAIRETGELGKRAPRYTFAILDRWAADGREQKQPVRSSQGGSREQPATDIKAALELAGVRSPMAPPWPGDEE